MSATALSHTTSTDPQSFSYDDSLLIKLAREIALDLHTIPQILEHLQVSADDWAEIQHWPQFQKLLRSSVEEWQSATNTAERVRLKSMAFVEEALPEFFARAHDPKESLQHKIKTLEVVARFAGIGGMNADGVVPERMTVTINLGSDHQVRIEKDIVSRSDIIEGEVL